MDIGLIAGMVSKYADFLPRIYLLNRNSRSTHKSKRGVPWKKTRIPLLVLNMSIGTQRDLIGAQHYSISLFYSHHIHS